MTQSLLNAWLKKARRGNEKSFRSLVEATRENLFWPVRRIVGNDEDAEEILQEAYMTLWREAGRRLPERPDAWLYRFCVNRAVDRRRRMATVREKREVLVRRERSRAAAVGANAFETLQGSEAERLLAESLKDIGARERAVFLLRAVHEWPYSQIAEVLGVSESTVRNQFMQARKKIAGVFESRGVRL